MNLPEVAEKAERLARLAAEKDLSGVLLGARENLAWATGGRLAPIDVTREGGVAWLLVTAAGRLFVLADEIEMPRIVTEDLWARDLGAAEGLGGAAQSPAALGFEPIAYPWTEGMADPDAVVRRARQAAGGGALASDRPLEGVAALGAEIARLRAPITTAEVERFRALGRDAGEALGEVCRELAPGHSEREVAWRTADRLLARGAEPVVLLVGADERIARFRHPLPTDRRWEELVMIVVCARRAGLTVALTRLVSAGPVGEELARRTRAAASVFAHLLAATRPGASGAELYAVAARAYREAGFAGEERLHHQGGACGYLSRDWIAHPGCEELVASPQGFAWNPSVTGTKIEETVLAWPEGPEPLTTTPGWPHLEVEVEAGAFSLRVPDVATLADLRD